MKIRALLVASLLAAWASVACAQAPGVPYTFANQSGSVPASELDSNFTYLFGRTVAASDYGVSTTSSDNSAALQQIDAAGKVAVLQPGIYKIASTVAFSHSDTGIVCASNGGFNVSTGPAVPGYPGNGCWLQWVGPVGGTMMTITAPAGASNGRLHGNIVKGINFDGTGTTGSGLGQAANGLALYSEVFGTFDTLSFWNLSGGVGLRIDIQYGALAEPPESQFNEFRNIYAGPYNAEVGVNLTWASFNTMTNVVTQTLNADGIQFVGSDNNYLYNVVAFQNGTGYGAHFMSVSTPSYYPSNSNVIWGMSGSQQNNVRSDGQDVNSGCSPWYQGVNTGNACPQNNFVFNIDRGGNGVPTPTWGAGSNVIWTANDGTKGGALMSGGMAIGDTSTNQVAAAAVMTTEGLHIRNNNANHIVLDNLNGATAWQVKLDSTSSANANLILQTQGTGQVITNQIQLNTIVGGPGNTPTTTAGSCAGVGTVTGGGIAGTFQTTAACSGVIRLTFQIAAPHGWVCEAQDMTTTAVTLRETGYGTTYCNMQALNSATGASDSIVYRATAF